MAPTPAAADNAAAPRLADKAVLDVTVLLGGPSSEREVSILSGQAVARGLRQAGHKVTCADIGPRDTSALDRREAEVVFIALHGAFGESGEVQQLCRQRGLAYTGSGPRASALAIDKEATKRLCREAGLLTPDWAVVERGQGCRERDSLLGELSLPVVIKPVDGGSSVDVVIARDAAQRDAAVADLLERYDQLMVEQFVAGREMTVSILEDQALPVLEIRAARGFYDYTAKYADDAGTQYLFEHGLGEQAVARLQADAIRAFETLGCRDMGRVDFIVDQAGQAWLLEINTIPGFTGHSLLPMAAGRAGLKFDALVDRLVRLAARRGADGPGDD
jgi:D-alanine-D-alanine ligase